MTYLTIVLLLFTVALTYKKPKNSSTLFLYGIIAGWIISFYSYLFYLSNFNVYFKLISNIYDFSPGSWNRLVLENIDPDLFIRLFNGGILLFTYSFLLFAISFSYKKNGLKKWRWYAPLMLTAVIQACYYDPRFNQWLQNRFYGGTYRRMELFNQIRDSLDILFLTMKYSFLLASFFILIRYYVKNKKISFQRQYALYHILCLAPVVIIHTGMFSWAPEILVKATFIPDYHNYIKPKIYNLFYELNFFPMISLIALGFMILTFSRYQAMERKYNDKNSEINKRIKTASLGVRAFTHSIKNHVLAIKSEAEFLKEKYPEDKETLYSLDLIMKSCLMSYETLHNASSKLNTLSLKMHLVRLFVPVENALAKLSTGINQEQILFLNESSGYKAYMDEKHMTEVFYNMIINAIEALRGGKGIITITVREQDDWGFVSIHDTGPGIPPEHINDVFSPFFSTKSSATNWGVGLSYCHTIITGHNGKIEVESNEKTGTVFKVFIPLA
ncbi:sensor histidine kinase [Paenibacillus sp. HB172176]|uniref:sensor histidine kinase n=1 Tax=Paenibacillus sp. HB172176 TaxID=2493690 RepID=UPI00143B079F|nr:sensor histidine kinase [Paenibacillus sp. HB172176]